MIKISATGSTDVIVTLYEESTNLINPYFTWEVNRKGTNNNIVFYQDDISPAPYYYNKFNITIGTGSSGLTSGVVPLTPGEWVYNIHQMDNPYDLDLLNSIKIVENGLITIPGEFNTIPDYYSPDINTIPVYRG